jgi:hypothetical protein
MIGITFSKASAQIGNILKMQLYFINVNICSTFLGLVILYIFKNVNLLKKLFTHNAK